MSQTSYKLEPAQGVAGGLGDGQYEVAGRTAANCAIKFGRAVTLDNGDQCSLMDNVAKFPTGIALRNPAKENLSDTSVEGQYDDKDPVNMLQKGRVWVRYTGAQPGLTTGVHVRVDGRAQIQTITFDADFVTDNTIDLNIDGVAMTQESFDTDHETTIDNLAATIQSEFAQIATAVADEVARTIVLTGANDGADFAVTGLTVAGGASQAAGTVAETQSSIADSEAGTFLAAAESGNSVEWTAGAKWTGRYADGSLAELNINMVQ